MMLFIGLGLGVTACSSSEDDDLLEPVEMTEVETVDDQEAESAESQILTEYSDYEDDDYSSGDETIGGSEVTSEEAVDQALAEVSEPADDTYGSDDSSYDQGTAEGMAAELDNMALPQESDTMTDSEMAVPSYPDDSATANTETTTAPTTDYSDEIMDQTANPSTSDSEYIAANNSASYESPAAGSYGEYIVQPGDTLTEIAQQVMGSAHYWQDLASQNNLANPSYLLPGDIIQYPLTERSQDFQSVWSSLEADQVQVQAGETLTDIAKRVLGRRSFWRSLWQQNREQIPDPDLIYQGQVIKYFDPSKVQAKMAAKGWTRYGH
jgi:nucleoid-associated protein YgaU